VKKEPWVPYLTDFSYQDIGGNDDGQEKEDNPFFYEITNDNLHHFDEIAIDGDDIMSLSLDESESELGEEDEAIEYAKFMNMPSTDFALTHVGNNDLLFNWIGKQLNGMDDKMIADYERITIEIEKVERRLRVGFETVLQYFLQTDAVIFVSGDSVDFLKKLFLQYVGIVFETAIMIASLREENTNTLFQDDFVAALKHLGRTVYCEKSENQDEENLDNDKDTFFDEELMRILCSMVLGDLKVNDETYYLIQKSFEDFFTILVSNACKIQKEYKDKEPVSVDDLKVVLSLWQNSPFESSNSLIQKINTSML